MTDIIQVLLSSLMAFVALFIISKLQGKKQIAQLTFTDYVVGISLGSIAAQMTCEDKIPFYNFLIAMGVFFLLELIVTYLEITPTFFKKLFKGKPIILIEMGKIKYNNLKKCKLDINDLLGLLRYEGYFKVSDVEYAVFETSGDLSVLPTPTQKPIVAKDLDIKLEQAQLSQDLVLDGKIAYNCLKILNKDEQWLFKQLGVKNLKDIKNIVLAEYDAKNNNTIVHTKSDN